MTNEITCDGIKISGIKYGFIDLPKLKSVDVQFEEQIFYQLNNSKCKVTI